VAALKTSQIAGLTTAQVAALTSAQVVALTTAQVAGLTTAQVAGLTTAQVAAMQTADVAALKTSQIAVLTTAQVAALTSVQVAALKTAQVAGLTTANVVALTSVQVAALTTAQVAGMTTAQVAGMTTAQVAAMETADVAALKTSQIAGLTTAQVAALTSAQVVALTTAQVAGLTTSSVAALSSAQVVALTTAQVGALTAASLAALTTGNMAAMETADVAALTTAQVAALTTAHAIALTNTQVAAFTSSQICALNTSGLMNSLTTAQISALTSPKTSTPIILDINGDGIKTLSISSGVNFDLFADGNNVNTGWVSSGDGLLVLDRNHDGQINDGSELFGSSTTLASGAKAPDGYVALRELDSNHDGVISNSDANFDELRVWVDANSDGISGAGETKSLASLEITKIELQAKAGIGTDNGNLVGLTSTYETADGTTHAAADVWFATDRINSSTGSTSINSAAIVPVPVEAKTDLRSLASNLAQAMGSYGDSSSAQSLLSGARYDASSSVAATNTAFSLAVVSMVDVMKQFDSNGNMLGSQGISAASLGKSLNLLGIQDPVTHGFLALGGK
jgi:hypothetical protein